MRTDAAIERFTGGEKTAALPEALLGAGLGGLGGYVLTSDKRHRKLNALLGAIAAGYGANYLGDQLRREAATPPPVRDRPPITEKEPVPVPPSVPAAPRQAPPPWSPSPAAPRAPAAPPPAPEQPRVSQVAAPSAPRRVGDEADRFSEYNIMASAPRVKIPGGRAPVDTEEVKQIAYGGAENLDRARAVARANIEAAKELTADEKTRLLMMLAPEKEGIRIEVNPKLKADGLESSPTPGVSSFNIATGRISGVAKMSPDDVFITSKRDTVPVDLLNHEIGHAAHDRSGIRMAPSFVGRDLSDFKQLFRNSERLGVERGGGDSASPKWNQNERWSVIPELKGLLTREFGSDFANDPAKVRELLDEVRSRGQTTPHYYIDQILDDDSKLDKLMKYYPYVVRSGRDDFSKVAALSMPDWRSPGVQGAIVGGVGAGGIAALAAALASAKGKRLRNSLIAAALASKVGAVGGMYLGIRHGHDDKEQEK